MLLVAITYGQGGAEMFWLEKKCCSRGWGRSLGHDQRRAAHHEAAIMLRCLDDIAHLLSCLHKGKE
jgi:hypothetical protein